ncbi:MAG TPA: hypothetical protein VHB53_08110, partial [Solirubrobacterales bacterium]|nr:hypothetical protein [Solirubrobacterales bacterium]
ATSVAALGSILATHTAGATGAASARADFVDGLDVLLLISGLLAIAGGLCAIALIRRRDFVVHAPQGESGTDGGAGRDRVAGRESEATPAA